MRILRFEILEGRRLLAFSKRDFLASSAAITDQITEIINAEMSEATTAAAERLAIALDELTAQVDPPLSLIAVDQPDAPVDRVTVRDFLASTFAADLAVEQPDAPEPEPAAAPVNRVTARDFLTSTLVRSTITVGELREQLSGAAGVDPVPADASDVTDDSNSRDGETGMEPALVVILRDGPQSILGTKADEVFYLLGDGGEPQAEQDGNALDSVLVADPTDAVSGGGGADTFVFSPLINGRPGIIAKHRGDGGTIDWTMNGVAGENNNVHDHWVEGVGHDTILDFNKAEGDRILIHGHTVQARIVSRSQIDDEVFRTDLVLSSDQGGAGAHDGDFLGLISVYGDDLVEPGDLEVDATPFYSIELLSRNISTAIPI